MENVLRLDCRVETTNGRKDFYNSF
jgi:hypothetical protein